MGEGGPGDHRGDLLPALVRGPLEESDPELLLFVSYRGTDSRRTRSLIRGLMPRSLTTSTL